ncbi:MAG: hypothetical protein ACTSU3_07595 [Candidatus Thorarchaeota archaeon]
MKNRTIISFGILFAMFIIAPSFIAVSAQGPMNPMDPGQGHRMHDPHRDNAGTVWINTDIITIMANSQSPMLHFWYTADENGSAMRFSASYVMISEFEDMNGDDAFQFDEVLHHAPLSAYEWTLQTGSIVEDGITTELWLKYTKGGVRSGGMMPADAPLPASIGMGSVAYFEDVTIQIWAHLYLEDYEGNVTDDHGVQAEYLVAGGSELKMDIEIGNFPFSSENTSASIQTMLMENDATGQMPHNQYHFRTHERTRNTTCNSNMNWTTPGGNETMFEHMNNTNTQKIDFIDGTTTETTGFFSWLDKATITWPGGETEAVNVTGSYAPMGMGLAVNLAYPNFDDGTILHDPSIGLDESIAPVSLSLDTTLLIGVGVVAVLAIVVIGLKRK